MAGFCFGEMEYDFHLGGRFATGRCSENVLMQLVVNTYGAYLQRRGELFQIKADGKVSEVSARKVQSIIITTGAAFSTDAVQLATEKNIDIPVSGQIRRSVRSCVARSSRFQPRPYAVGNWKSQEKRPD